MTLGPAAADTLAALARLGLPADVPTDFLLVARRGGRLVGAAFAQRVGTLAEVLPPAADTPADAAALADELVRRLAAAGVTVAQALTDEPCEPLAAAGFRYVTDLVTMTSPAAPEPEARATSRGSAPASLDLARASGSKSTGLLEATYAATLAGSLDLPELSVLRTPAEELARFPADGRYVARHAGRPVGVLLLAPAEVMYLGLVPAARGRGFGSALLRAALSHLTGPAVSVGVDGRNRPAVRLYDRHGFRMQRSQRVHLWSRTN